jgi:hypothetical protein
VTIDPDRAKALVIEPLTVAVERGRLRFFAKAIGETDPVNTDVDAARAAGHPDLPVPPSFFFSLGLEAPDPFRYIEDLGVELSRVLHGEQSFTYHRLAFAGDTLALQDRIVDVYAKKGGVLEFVVKQTEITRGDELVAHARSVVVVRNPEVGQ